MIVEEKMAEKMLSQETKEVLILNGKKYLL